MHGKDFVTKSRVQQKKVLEKENFLALWQSAVLSTALDQEIFGM